MESRAVLERFYNNVQIRNQTVQTWIRFMLPPTICAATATAIISTFVSVQYTELPLILYIFFPFIAFTIMTVIFWLSYDANCGVRVTEEILGKLLSQHTEHLSPFPPAVRIQVMKRDRAMKALEFPVGDFAEFWLSLSAAIWDEILNQVMFFFLPISWSQAWSCDN